MKIAELLLTIAVTLTLNRGGFVIYLLLRTNSLVWLLSGYFKVSL